VRRNLILIKEKGIIFSRKLSIFAGSYKRPGNYEDGIVQIQRPHTGNLNQFKKEW
jgi:hypothetical protein